MDQMEEKLESEMAAVLIQGLIRCAAACLILVAGGTGEEERTDHCFGSLITSGYGLKLPLTSTQLSGKTTLYCMTLCPVSPENHHKT